MPIVLSTKTKSNQYGKGKKQFRFEAMWVQHEKCRKIVENAWKDKDTRKDLNQVMYTISTCSKQLTDWSKNGFVSIKRNLSHA